jgi:hypothetical protein
MGDVLPAGRLDVRIDGSGEDVREITVETGDPGYGRLVEAAR